MSRAGAFLGRQRSCPVLVFFVKSDILKFELYCLLCIIALAFDGVLTNVEEVIKREVTHRSCVGCSRFAVPHFNEQFRHVHFDWYHFASRGVLLAKPSIMTCSAGKNLSDPMTFVGLCSMVKDIVCPTAVIAPVTVAVCTCCPCA